MMNRDIKVIGGEGDDGYGTLAGTVAGFIVVALLLGMFQFIDHIQAPPQNTFKDYAPWKSTRIAPVTQVAVGPPTPQKPAVIAAPQKPPVPKPEATKETPKVEEVAKAEEEARAAEAAAKAEEEARAAEAAARAEEEARAAEAAARAEEEARAAEAAAKAEEEARAAEAAAKAEEEARAAEAAAKAEEEARAAEAAARAEEEARAAEAAARAEEEARAAEAAARAEEEARAAANHRAEILNAVESWASAWSDQRIDAYIDSYTADFKPQQYKSREYWEAQRRKRLARPSSISIQLSNIQTSLAEDGTAIVTFVQVYKSPIFSDSVRKTLVLRQESGRWKISSETSKKL